MSFLITYQSLLSQIMVASLLALGMFIWFRVGLFSFATAGIMAVGAYTSAIMTTVYKQPFIVSLLGGLLLAMVVAAALSYLLLKLSHIYFAMATIAFSELIRLVALNWEVVTLGAQGIAGIPAYAKPWQLLLALIIMAYCTARIVGRNKLGRAADGLREDPVVAGTLGINVSGYKIFYFVLGAVPTALAGIFKAHTNMYISPSDFGFELMIAVVMMTVVGGMNLWQGAIVGAVVVTFLPEVLRVAESYMLIVNAIILLAVILYLPNGIAGFKFWTRIRPKKVQKNPIAQTTRATVMTDFLPHSSTDQSTNSRNVLLAVKSLSLNYGGLLALNKVSLELKRGQVHGLIGPNGAGKTSLLNSISGLSSGYSGTMEWKGKDISRIGSHQLAHLGIARTYQNIRLLKDETVLENVLMGAHQRLDCGIVDTILQLKRAKRSEQSVKEQAYALLKWLDLDEYAHSPAGSLAYGVQRRVEVARALVSKPTVLLLDEPTSGMNDAESDMFGDLIMKLKEAGLTILLIEHHIPLIMRACDEVLVINFGAPIACGTPNEIKNDPKVIEAYLGSEQEEFVDNADRMEEVAK